MLVSNHAAVARFAARGCGRRGDKPVSAPLSDPTARPDDEYVPAVDAALRRVCAELLSENGAILFILFIFASASAIKLTDVDRVYLLQEANLGNRSPACATGTVRLF